VATGRRVVPHSSCTRRFELHRERILLRLELTIVNLGLINFLCLLETFQSSRGDVDFGLEGVGGREVGENCDAGHLVRNSMIMCKAHLSTVAQRLQRWGSSKDMSRVSKVDLFSLDGNSCIRISCIEGDARESRQLRGLTDN
jgi:hypothetical protein